MTAFALGPPLAAFFIVATIASGCPARPTRLPPVKVPPTERRDDTSTSLKIISSLRDGGGPLGNKVLMHEVKPLVWHF